MSLSRSFSAVRLEASSLDALSRSALSGSRAFSFRAISASVLAILFLRFSTSCHSFFTVSHAWVAVCNWAFIVSHCDLSSLIRLSRSSRSFFSCFSLADSALSSSRLEFCSRRPASASRIASKSRRVSSNLSLAILTSCSARFTSEFALKSPVLGVKMSAYLLLIRPNSLSSFLLKSVAPMA